MGRLAGLGEAGGVLIEEGEAGVGTGRGAQVERTAPLAAARGTPQMKVTELDCDPADVARWDHTGAPGVAESPVSFECKCTEILQLKTASGGKIPSWLVLGEVVAVYIDKAFLRDGVYDTAAAQHLARGGGLGDYFWVEESTRLSMTRPK